MRAAHLPTVSHVRGGRAGGEYPPFLRSHVQGGECPPPWTYPPSEGTWFQRYQPPCNRLTDTCENISFPQLRWLAVIRIFLSSISVLSKLFVGCCHDSHDLKFHEQRHLRMVRIYKVVVFNYLYCSKR